MWGRFSEAKERLSKQYQENHFTDGMEASAVKEHIFKNIFENDTYTVYEKKTDAIVYLLQNARIDIAEDEFFADKIEHQDILSDYISICVSNNLSKLRIGYDTLAKNAETTKTFRSGMDFGHIAPDWNFVLQNGIPGILRRLQAYRAENADSPEKLAFYDCSIRVYEAILVLFERMANCAQRKNSKKMQFMADNLRSLMVSAPKTLAQAMQLTLLFYTIQKDLDCTIVRSLGGLDRMYFPFYRADLKSGAFTESQLHELTRDFLWKINAM